MDIWTKEKRSAVMSKIRGKNTKPESVLRSELFKRGYRFRIHRKDLPGNPDIVLPKYKLVIFVHGCFWHFHTKCDEGRIPNSNTEFWKLKLSRNVEKDKENLLKLKNMGWKTYIAWECNIEKRFEQTINEIKDISLK